MTLTRRQALLMPLFSQVLASPQALANGRPLAVKNSTVIDGTGAVQPARTVVARGDRIVVVGEAGSVTVPPGAQIVDGRGRFLIPGLWDMHVHLSWTKAAALPALLANGVTGVRDMGGLLGEIDEWRTQILLGERSGPRIVRAGPTVNGKVFAFHQIAVADAAEARGAVRALQKAGVDFIKVHAAISREAYYGVSDECKKLDLPFAGHIPRAITPAEASDAGQASLEHADTLFDGRLAEGIPPDEIPGAIARFAKEGAPELFARFARNETWLTPTLSTLQAAFHMGDKTPGPRDKYVSQFSKKIMAELLRRPNYQEAIKPAAVARQKRQFQELLPLVGAMNRAGVGLLAGTDLASSLTYPGFSLHDELALLVEAGLTPMGALQTATRNPARLLKRDDLGTIGAGKLADLVLLDANPLDDIRNTQRIQAVIFNGALLDRRALDSLLAATERQAKEE